VIPDQQELEDIEEPSDTLQENNDASEESVNEPVIKPNYDNPGLDRSTLAIPKTNGPITRSKGKLRLDNDILPIDESINSYPRVKKQPYKQVEYKEAYAPPVFEDPILSKPR
ncbi:MAG TPA: hypothetical protein V6D48_00665, partial [Oculatellaceae cyanobacterium]